MQLDVEAIEVWAELSEDQYGPFPSTKAAPLSFSPKQRPSSLVTDHSGRPTWPQDTSCMGLSSNRKARE